MNEGADKRARDLEAVIKDKVLDLTGFRNKCIHMQILRLSHLLDLIRGTVMDRFIRRDKNIKLVIT